MKTSFKLFGLLIAIAVLISACGTKGKSSATTEGKTVEYSLMTGMIDGQMAFIGVDGGIDGVRNPTLSANVGDTVKVTLTGGDGVEHDIAFPDFNAQSEHITGKGSTSTFEFVADKPGSFSYNCLLAGHKEAGMIGKFEVTGSAPVSAAPASGSVSSIAAPSGPVVVSNPPATGADIGTPPSINAIVDAQIEACEVDPLEATDSETTRMV